LVVADGDDPLVTQAAREQLRRERHFGSSHIVEGGGDASSWDEVIQPKCDRPLGSSHVGEGGGDALLETSERNPPFNPQFEFHQQSVNRWLTRDELEIPQHESAFEVRRCEQKQRSRDFKHYLSQDWNFARIAR
jgi:hypothetical protein